MQTAEQSKQKLFDLLRTQDRQYGRIMKLLAGVRDSAGQQLESTTSAASQVHAMMQELAVIDTDLAALRPELEQTGVLKQPEVQEILLQQENVLLSLIANIDDSLGHVSDKQKKLTNSLEGGVQRNTMQAAYRMSLRTG